MLENSAHQSDSESDEDYVPPHDDKDSDDSEQSDKEDNQNRVVDEQVDPEAKKRAREALWSSFQSSVLNTASSSSIPIQEPKKVKIERKYRFAGEEVVEVAEVPEDSPEAKKWPLWKEPITESSTGAPTENLLLPFNPSSPPIQTPTSTISESTTFTPTSLKPPLKKPKARKPKTSLTPLPSKPKKLSTLDKSAMDWQAHIHSEQHPGLKDELEANRKGGGYLEKVQFLKRVEERKEETLDASKSSKRRKL